MMNKRNLTGLLSMLCVLLCALVLFSACTGDQPSDETDSTGETTTASAEATDASTDETTTVESAPAESDTNAVDNGKVTYTITVVDGDGNPVEGVDVQMCNADGTCLLPVRTDANGVATFSQAEAEYYVTIASSPEGYISDNETKHYFEEGSVEMTVTIEKAAETPTGELTEASTEAPSEP